MRVRVTWPLCAGLALISVSAASNAQELSTDSCSLVISDRFVAVQTTAQSGRFCVDGSCRQVSGRGLIVVPVRVGPSQLAAFSPASTQRGCAAAGRQPSAPPQVSPAIVTGTFTLLAGIAGLFGSLVIDLLRSRRERKAKAIQWIAEFKQKLSAFREDAIGDTTSPPIPAVDWRSYRVLSDVQTAVTELVSKLPPETARKERVRVVAEAIVILDSVRKI